MARRKNVKRIDPRYFLHETVDRNDDGSRLEEIFGFSKKEKLEKLWDPEHGGYGGEHAQHQVERQLEKAGIAGEVYPEKIIEKAREIWLASEPTHKGKWTDPIIAAVQAAIEPEVERITAQRAERASRRKAEDDERAAEQAAKAAERAAYEAEREAEYEKKRKAQDAEDRRGTGSWTDVFDFSHQLEEGDEAWFSVPDSTKRRIRSQDAADRADRSAQADRQRRKDKGNAGLENPEHMQTQKSNVAYAGSGGVGKSGKRYEE